MLVALVVHLALAFQDPVPIGAAVLRAAVAEAAAIWAPYGFVLERAPLCDAADNRALVLSVDTVGAAAPGRGGPALGAIVFGPDGTPEPRISLFLDEVVRLVADARVLSLDESHWPKRLRDEILGRVLGRVLAHEIGHYALRSRQHGGEGLMRSIQRADELAARSRKGFRLSALEAAQLSSLEPGSEVAMKKERTGTSGRPWGEAQPDAALTSCCVLVNAR
jgi:hypothetical protein